MYPLLEINCDGWLSALPRDIRLEWKGQTMTNTLDYYDAAKITAIKSFIFQTIGYSAFCMVAF